jgi:hypothetical protein
MNQQHEQPSPVEYANGDPSSWAEDQAPESHVKSEYDGDHEARNSLGFPEFRKDTFDHKDEKEWDGKGKYDNQRTSSEKKAQAAIRLSSSLLRSAKPEDVKAQAKEFMALPPQALVAALKRVHAASPAALPGPARYNRASACVKLASRLVGQADEATVERLAREIYKIEDSVLRPMLQIVATVKLAEIEMPVAHKGGPEHNETEEKKEETAGAPPGFEPKPSAEACEMASDIVGDAPETDELSALFETPATEAPAAPAVASKNDIHVSFDEDETASNLPGDDALDALFNDHPDVQAQRELVAANKEGYKVPVNRTASSNPAKKVGNVKSKSTSEDDLLAKIWD